MKEKLIILAISMLWGVAGFVYNYITNLKDNQIVINQKLGYIEKESDNLVKKDVYEVDKMLLMEKFRR